MPKLAYIFVHFQFLRSFFVLLIIPPAQIDTSVFISRQMIIINVSLVYQPVYQGSPTTFQKSTIFLENNPFGAFSLYHAISLIFCKGCTIFLQNFMRRLAEFHVNLLNFYTYRLFSMLISPALPASFFFPPSRPTLLIFWAQQLPAVFYQHIH